MSVLVSYRRTSGDASENTSLESQRTKIEAKCIIDEHTIVADFCDKESAETAERREGFQSALEMIYSGKADGLIVWKLDRFARSVLDGVKILSEFKRLKKELVCVADPIDTTSPMGEAFFQISMVFAELERKTIAERCHGGRLARAAQLRYACGSPPYGWCTGEQANQRVLLIDHEEQAVIQRIKSLREATNRMSYARIAKVLTDLKIAPPCKNRNERTTVNAGNSGSTRSLSASFETSKVVPTEWS